MRNEDNYKEKIRKLLALAESPNEHEARAALLKARQLMAEHKLTEAELKDVEKQEVKDIRTDITWIAATIGMFPGLQHSSRHTTSRKLRRRLTSLSSAGAASKDCRRSRRAQSMTRTR